MHLAHPRAQLAGLLEDRARVASEQLARWRGYSVHVCICEYVNICVCAKVAYAVTKMRNVYRQRFAPRLFVLFDKARA